MDVYWLEQHLSDVPEHDGWLSPAEVGRLHTIHIPKRRADWRLGRWAAKRAIATHLNSAAIDTGLPQIEVRPNPTGAPEVYVAGAPAPLAVSLTHRNGSAICAVAPAGTSLGCDLELVEPRSDGFAEDYFVEQEQRWIERAPAADRYWLLALTWSAKESALKAMQVGMREDTRSVRAIFNDDVLHASRTDPYMYLDEPANLRWRALQVRYAAGRTFHGWWRRADDLVHTIVADPAPSIPIQLQAGSPAHPQLAR